MIKKTIAMLLIAVMCIAPAASFADETVPEEGTDEENVVTEFIEPDAPAKVESVKLSCSKANNITISWGKVADADGYKVYRWNKTKQKYVCIKTTSKLSYVDSNKSSYTRYVYKVKAYIEYENEEGKTVKKYGKLSDKKAIRTKVIVGKVKNIDARGTDWNKTKITWDKVSGATGYKVYRWSTAKDKYVLIGKTTKCKYTDSGLYPHTRYTYKVAAYKKYTNTKGKKCVKTGAKSVKNRAYTLRTVHGYTLGKPVKNMTVGSAYGWRGGAFHQGTDFIRPKGTKVYAATSGYVYRSRDNYGGLGKGIVIKNSNGVTTWYGHLSKRCVKQGTYVKKGQLIGRVGSTGNAGSCNHLHYEVWVDGNHYNPMKFY